MIEVNKSSNRLRSFTKLNHEQTQTLNSVTIDLLDNFYFANFLGNCNKHRYINTKSLQESFKVIGDCSEVRQHGIC